MSVVADDCGRAALAQWGDGGFARVTALAKGGYLGTAGHTTSDGAGVGIEVTIEPATTDEAAWTSLAAAIRAWRPDPHAPPARPQRPSRRAHG